MNFIFKSVYIRIKEGCIMWGLKINFKSKSVLIVLNLQFILKFRNESK